MDISLKLAVLLKNLKTDGFFNYLSSSLALEGILSSQVALTGVLEFSPWILKLPILQLMVKNGLAYSFLSCLGTLGIDVLNNAIETLMGSCNREQWIQAVFSVSDSVMQADQTEVRLFVILLHSGIFLFSPNI